MQGFLPSPNRPSPIVVIKKIAKQLAKIDSVNEIRAIEKDLDFHQVEFEIKPNLNADISYELWEKIQDIVIEGERNLRSKTNKKWRFDVDIVDTFGNISSKKIITTQKRISNISVSTHA